MSRQSVRGPTRGRGATYRPEARALAQADQLPLHTAVPPARGQPTLGGEEPAVSASGEQLFHHHVADVPGRRRPTVVVPQADLLERAQRSRDARTHSRDPSARARHSVLSLRGGWHTSTGEHCAE